MAAKGRREQRRITIRAVENATGIDKNTVSAWVHNKVERFHGHIIVALCAYFDCEIGDLLILEDMEVEEGDDSPEFENRELLTA